ncbi:MAG: deoxyguanosinetriphosphate triphosphohydrolase [Ignavibacteriaceae bacterium]
MEWKKLLSKKLIGDEKILPAYGADGRTQFQKDFDRIVFCSAFRRLQDKTQVFPLPESDFVHTRLTHSLEVSCVGRSLGSVVGKTIIERHPDLKEEFTSFNFGEIVAAACLSHDIGNPPFGHSGEDAISEYFRVGNGKSFEHELLSIKCWNDFAKFEGNAQGFRILTRLQNPNIKGGLKLTCATLAAFTKYPKDSSSLGSDKKLSRKFGYFQAEKDLFREVEEEVGLEKIKDNWWSRHPLVFLVEAADDICYRIMDLEDAFRLGLLSFKDTEELLKPLCDKAKFTGYSERNENDKIGYLRAKSISVLIDELAAAFLAEEENMLAGKFEGELISIIDKAAQLEHIKKLSVEKIYSYKSVVEREAAGYEVLGGLLDTYIHAVNELESGKPSLKNKTMLKLLPKQFLGANGKPDEDLYTRLLKITDFVSGMTDSYAVSLFRKIKGISLPGRGA